MSKDILSNSRKHSEGRKSSRGGLGLAAASCAFHTGEKITNFCTNRECLLPLCPKCVKIHAE